MRVSVQTSRLPVRTGVLVLLVTVVAGWWGAGCLALAGDVAVKAAAPAGESAAIGPFPDWLSLPKNVRLGPGRLSLDLNIRTRYEYSDNFNVKRYGTERSDDLLLFRTQFGVEYRLDLPGGQSGPRTYVQVQDARHWLSDLDRHDFPETCPFFDQFDLRQAFLEWRKVAGSPWGFKVGRQNIAYADNRIFGPGDWGNGGRYWWDAAKMYIETEPAKIDFIYGRRVISEQVQFNDRHYDFDMFSVYAQVAKLPFRLDAFYMLRLDEHGEVKGERGWGDEERHSLGCYVDGRAGGWDYGGTLVGQFGNCGGDDILAVGLNARAGYTFDVNFKPRLGVEFSYASGDEHPLDGRNQTFDGVFGAIDMFYGRMNFLSWKNMEDYQLSAGIQPMKRIKVTADLHLFRLASANDAWYWCSGNPMRRDRSGHSGRTLGGELDLIAKWEVGRNLEVMAGYGHFFPGVFIGNTGSDDHADWVFTQVTWKF